MKNCGKKISLFLGTLAVCLMTAAAAWAAPVSWMPGFPMRMGTNIMLMWTPIPGASAYNIYKSAKDGDLGALLISVPANNHMDMNVGLDQSAFYTVKAVTGGAEGEASLAGKIIGVKPLDPPRWTGTMFNEGTLNLRWGIDANAAFYNVYKAAAPEGPFLLLGSVQEPKYLDTALEVGKSYYYQVTSVDKNNTESPKSATETFTLQKEVKTEVAKEWAKVERIVKFVDQSWGPDEDPLQNPAVAAVNSEGSLYVSDRETIAAMKSDMSFLGRIVMPEGYDTKKAPWGDPRGGLTIDGDRLYATYYKFRGVRIFNMDGDLLKEFRVVVPTKEEYIALKREKDWEEDKNRSINPTGVAVDGEGRIWVGESEFRQLHVYTPDGELIKKIGEPLRRGDAPDNFGSFGAVRYHKKTNRIYAADQVFGKIWVFDTKTMELIKDDKGETIYGYGRRGGGPGRVQQLAAFWVSDNEAFIGDGITGRIFSYDLNLDYTGTIVTKANTEKPEQVNALTDIVVFGNTMYVTSTLDNRINILSLK